MSDAAAETDLRPRGRAARVAVTLVGVILLLAGTFWGQDDDFPFGPFRMYSTSDPLNAPVRDTRVEGRDANGRLVDLDENNTGFRRAEVEGQLPRFRADPALLSLLANAYGRRHPEGPAITEVTVIVRWHDLKDGRPTGVTRDEPVATWKAP